MIYNRLRIRILREDQDYYTDFLASKGIDTLQIEDGKDVEDYYNDRDEWIMMDPPEEAGETVDVIFFTESSVDPEELLKDAERPKETVTKDTVDDADYLDRWKEFYEPVFAGNLVVVPSWNEETFDEKTIRIDPGMAFGTGEHETTKICLEMLQDIDIKGRSVLDVGTGSGILAFGAEKLGAGKVLGIDIDETAIRQAEENKKLNDSRAEFITGDLTKDIEDRYDIVLGNLLSHIVLHLSEELPEVLKEEHEIIFSGILETERKKVSEELEERGYRILDHRTEGQWCGIRVRYAG